MPSDQPTDAPGPRRPRLTPPIAEVRRAVRSVLPEASGSVVAASHVSGFGDSARNTAPSGAAHGVPAESPNPVTEVVAAPLVLVALSGGADSLALAAATAFEAPRLGLRAGAVVVDHGLQAGSAEVAAAAAATARELGLEPVLVRRV